MHINMKYYIVSIGAIFISLGIGILVGYNLNYDQELSKQQASVISDLDNKFDALKVTNDNLEKSLADLSDDYDKAIAFINDNVNNLVVGRLTDKNIGIISTNQDNDYTKEIKEIITTANGNVAFDITLNNNIFNEKKIEELATKLNLEIKDTKDIMAYIEEALSESNATLKLKELEDAEMIKINSLNENYQSYNSVVIAGGNNGKLGKEQYENIDKILIETLKDKDKNIVGVQESNTKFSYVDLYFNDKVTTIDNVNWLFSNRMFALFIEDLEKYSSWQYSGESELLLIGLKEGILSYENVMQFYLDQMIRDGVIYSIHQFFENLFRICKDKASMGQISNTFGMNKVKQVSLDALLDKLPLGLGKVFIQEKYFCVKNMER